MTFLFPLGLLGLIGVPVLIIIYIIKNKYTEQVIASTYLWTLSEKFLKRRIPIKRLAGIISLILQIAAVVCISLAIAHPVISLPGAAHDYCFILDASGSMNMVQNGSTRFDLAKDEIEKLITDSKDGSSYTLIYAGAKTDVIFEGAEDKEFAVNALGNLKADYSDNGFTEAVDAAQRYFNANTSVKTYVVTDKSVGESNNIVHINVADSSLENYALSDVKAVLKDGKINVGGNVFSHKDAGRIKIGVYADGAETAVASTETEVTNLTKTSFNIACDIKEYDYLKVVIENGDCLDIDNSVLLYNINSENRQKALIISETPFFLKAVLLAVGFTDVEVATPVEYLSKSGYDLYVFNSCEPAELPADGAVWFFNPTHSVENSGFTVQRHGIELNVASDLVCTRNTAQVVGTLLKNVRNPESKTLLEPVKVKKYTKCGLSSNFIRLLEYEGDPVVFTGMNKYNFREAVFAFDFKDTDLAMRKVFIALVKNLIDFTFPSVIDKTLYNCGEKIDINVVSNCRSIRIDSPSGEISYADTSNAVNEYELAKAGLYEITVISGNSQSSVYHVFATMAENESNPSVSEEKIGLSGTATEGNRDGKFDNLWILFLLVGVVCIADWMVYCYEQYQLR